MDITLAGSGTSFVFWMKLASSLFLKACAFSSCMSSHAWIESASALALPGNLHSEARGVDSAGQDAYNIARGHLVKLCF